MTLITASVDAWVDQDVPGGNHGDAARLSLSNTASHVRQAFVFLPRPFPLGATVTSATLTVYAQGDWSGARTLTASRVKVGWKEGTVNWTNRPTGTDVTSTNEDTASGSSLADQAPIQFDLTAMLQDVADGDPWHGVRITTSDSAVHSLYSSDAALATLWPTLDVEYAEPPFPPTNLSPDGGRASSLAEPTLSWRFRDSSGAEGQQAYSQVQIDTTEDLASPIYDTGQAANVSSSWDTTTVGAVTDWGAGLTDGQEVYWRVKVWDDSGLASDWSDVAHIRRETQGTLAVSNPPDGGTVEETTPPVAWTLTGATQEEARIVLDVINDKGLHEELWRMPRTVTTGNSFNIPADLLKTGDQYRVRVTTWDTENRQDISGDPSGLTDQSDFTYVRSGAPAPVTSLTATVDGYKVTLTWVRSTMPDYFSVRVDGREEMQRIVPADVFVSGTTYSMEWWRAEPGTSHTFEVEAVVLTTGKNKHSGGNATATATPRAFGIALADDSDPTGVDYVVMRGLEGPDLSIGETGETFNPIGTRRPVRITDSVRGYEGTVTGLLLSDAERETFETLKGRLVPLRLMVANVNVPVILGESSVSPVPEAANRWEASFEVAQVDEFTFDVG